MSTIDTRISTNQTAGRTAPVDRSLIRRRVRFLKRAVVAASLAGFVGLWAVVAGHVVGVTSHAQSAPNSAPAGSPSQPSGGFFGAGSGTNHVNPGNGGSPSLSSGPS
jgi:hypothetical protein